MPHFLIIAQVKHDPDDDFTVHVQEFSAPCLISAAKTSKVMADFVSEKLLPDETTIDWELQELTDLDLPEATTK